MRQLLTEGLLLAAIGGAAGTLLAVWATRLFSVSNLGNFPRADEVTIDGWVLLFTLATSIATAILFGLAPALQGSKSNPNATLNGGRRSSGPGGGLRSLLVVSEIALSLVLLVGAGLLIKSFLRLQSVNAGFDPHNLLTLQTTLPRKQYPIRQNRMRSSNKL